ncbi:SDR family oxidoreductase [Odoribacter splanchnicus]|jgi:hypothetical protein|uniref:SDR family oxidoreductase n=1 Tax=Odoribacter splanchnicus TaxID=28118 RepID=UPI000E47AA86|nr:SDR family oxidoreductase [Odoribacter splanchnicus]NUN81334.1 SDR family oxidoreductase [Odoribacter splanchnicus]RHL78856.1 SDR family NAD(P)-dependent oxidoreductase [Odoribacter splanchnicus]
MKYEEIQVGTTQQLTHTITQADIEKFVDLSGDDNKLHVDKAFAARTSFKKPVVHGMIGASFISTVIGTKLPGDGALWYSQTLDFLLPVRIGDMITVVAEVIKKNDRERSIELDVRIFNQNRQIVTRGISKVKVIDEDIPVNENLENEENPRVALVIGATGGIGNATCLQLAKDGFNLILHYNKNKDKARKLQEEIKALGREVYICQGDVNQLADIDALIDFSIRKFSGIDVLVNCAAFPIPTIKATDLLWTDFLTQLEINIKVNLLLIQKVLPVMVGNGYGKIITLSSEATDKPNANWAHYITAKSALEGLTKSLAYELAPKGIRINMVSPSMVSTELTADIPEKMKLMTAAQTPLRRLARPEDVAGVISFLASSKSDFLVGENIRLNGGQVML